MPKSIPNEKCETVGSGNVGVYKLKCLIVALYFILHHDQNINARLSEK